MEVEQQKKQYKENEVEEIQSLIKHMQQQGRNETSQDLLQVAKYFEEMQKQFNIMTKELQEVRQQLSNFQQGQPRKQVEESIQEVSNLQKTMINLSEKISIGKNHLKDVAEQAILVFRETGKEERNKILQKGISKVKSVVLESREQMTTTLTKYQKLASKIDSIGEELKQVGNSIGNVGRLVAGKDTKEISKEKQGIGIIRGINQPIKKHIVSLQQKLERTDRILEKLDKISKDLGKEVKQEQRISIQEKLSEKKEVVEQKKLVKKKEQGLGVKGKRQKACL